MGLIVNVRVAPLVVSSSPTAMNKKRVVVHMVKRFTDSQEQRFFEMDHECRVDTWCGKKQLDAFPASTMAHSRHIACKRCGLIANFETYHIELAAPLVNQSEVLRSGRYGKSILYYRTGGLVKPIHGMHTSSSDK